MKVIGITTTVPLEVLLAAGYNVVDLNNVLVSSAEHDAYIDLAERDGFPKSSCAWIKGIYGACIQNNIQEIIGVVEGDCSNTKALLEVFQQKGIAVHPFSYPHTRRMDDVKASIDSLMKHFQVTACEVEKVRKQLEPVRELAKRIDELTWRENKASGFENHLYQVMLSDMNGDLERCLQELKDKIAEIEQRPGNDRGLRLGYIGVPPMTCDLYSYVERFNARVVFNEVQREFAFPRACYAQSIYEQYTDYTYPYDIRFRLAEIRRQIAERQLDGIIHYTQAFCYRAIEDIVIKSELDIPVITIEGDKLQTLDSRTKIRLEAFLDMLADQKGDRG